MQHQLTGQVWKWKQSVRQFLADRNTQRKRTVFRLYIDHTGSQSILLREFLCELLETFERSAAYQRSLSCESSSSVQLKKDAEQETEERATANTLMMTKLENIADDVKDIKRDYKETRAEVQDLHDRVLIVEQSLKSYHKRLDGMNLNIKTDQ